MAKKRKKWCPKAIESAVHGILKGEGSYMKIAKLHNVLLTTLTLKRLVLQARQKKSSLKNATDVVNFPLGGTLALTIDNFGK